MSSDPKQQGPPKGWQEPADPNPITADEVRADLARLKAEFQSEPSHADAHLIAAAPDLLVALERIVALGASDPERFTAEIGDADKQARAAIAKARALPPTAAVAPSAPPEETNG